MSDRPILFSPSMVRALIGGRKTQTRRLLNPQPPEWCAQDKPGFSCLTPRGYVEFRGHYPGEHHIEAGYGSKFVKLPVLKGDRLYVREVYFQRGHWAPVAGESTKGGRQKWAFVPADELILFDAPETFRTGIDGADPAAVAWHKRLARFMPRRVSRLTLIVENVRVERLQSISEGDAEAEGVVWDSADGFDVWYVPGPPYLPHTATAAECYRGLWASLHDAEGQRWEDNPFVVATTFRVVPGNIDRVKI